MRPSPAEVARTLAAGRLPATLHVACGPGPQPVRHAADAAGRPLLLTPANGIVADALRPAPGTEDTAVMLDVADVPPVAGAPGLGRASVAGWARRLSGHDARTAALDYLDVDSTDDLLDLGRGFDLYRIEVAEVRLACGERVHDVDPDEYAAAEPDPLHATEWKLVTDLAEHHGAEMAAYLRRRIGGAARCGQPRVMRLDRYGMLVGFGRRFARLSFPRPVRDRADLAQLLHPMLCPRCAARRVGRVGRRVRPGRTPPAGHR